MKVYATCLLFGLLLTAPAALAWESESGELRLRGRLQTRFEVEEQQDGDFSSRFRLKRARFDGRWKPSDKVRVVLEFEGAELLETSSGEYPRVELKDAYGRLQLHKALRIELGHLKKPFSRLKMESPFDLLLPVRGMLNRHAVADTRHGGHGGRGVGMLLSGRFKELARLRYYLGAFSGLGFEEGIEESHKDFVGRLQVRPFKGMRLAIGASHKLYHDTLGRTRTANLFGADLRYRFLGFTLLVEGAYGDNVDAGPGHCLWGVHGTLAYAIELGEALVLTPAFMVEAFDPDDKTENGRAIRFAGAINLDIEDYCRLILFAEGATGELRAFDEIEAAVRARQVATRVFLQVNMAF